MILAVDFGERYIGVAISDDEERLALRHSVIDQKRINAWQAIQYLVQQEKISRVVVGWPLNLARQETEQTNQTAIFIEKLREILPKNVLVATADETFSSLEAERRIRTEGLPKQEAHSEAARLILENYLGHTKQAGQPKKSVV